MRHLTFCTILCLLCLCGCSKSLSRSKAEELIRVQQKLPRLETCAIELGRTESSGKGGTPETFATTSDMGRSLKRLSDAGLLALTFDVHHLTSGYFPGDYLAWTVAVGDKGKPFMVGGIQKDSYSHRDYAVVKLGELQFGTITGITTDGGEEAKVDYTTKYGNITPFGSVGGLTCGRGGTIVLENVFLDPAKVQEASVLARRYDDGWRIEPTTLQ